MIRISIDLLIRRKKWLTLFVITFVLMISTTAAFQLSADNIKHQLEKQAFSNYGEHTAVLENVNDDFKTIRSMTDVAGEYEIIDTLKVSPNLSLSVGWMDQQAIKLSHIRLLKGNFPKNEHQIAIEESYLSKIKEEWNIDWKIGEKRTIPFEKGEKTVTLTGVIENYSSQWTVSPNFKRGINDFPNGFISPKVQMNKKSHSYLIKYQGNINKSMEKTYHLLDDYGENGFINEKLFYKGLKDYQNISMLCSVFKWIILVLSLLSLSSIVSYFHFDQAHKIGILKTEGANNSLIFKIKIYQYLFLLIISSIISIPFLYTIQTIIVHLTYNNGATKISFLNWALSNILPILVCILFLWMKSLFDIKQIKKHTITEMIKSKDGTTVNYPNMTFKAMLQKMKNKRQFLHLITIIFSLMTVMISFLLQQESISKWNPQNGYYMSANETIQYITEDDRTIVKSKKNFFDYKEIKKLESLNGVEYVKKEPFNIDLEVSTPQIIDNFETNPSFWKNVKVSIIDTYDLKKKNLPYSMNNLKQKMLIYTYNSKETEKFSKLIGKNIQISRLNANGRLETWKYPVLNVIEHSSTKQIENSDTEFIVDLNTAISNHLFVGYNNLDVYLKKNINNIQLRTIDQQSKKIAAIVPGSLYQNLYVLQIDENKIYYLLNCLGIISFSISIILTSMSLLILTIGKYESHKKIWGIYFSLGMTKKKGFHLLITDILILLIEGIIISWGLFIIIYWMIRKVHPLSYYLLFFSVIITFILVIFSFICLFIYLRVKKSSIGFLLRNAE